MLDRSKSRPTRIGLALAGGGPEGAIYEIGALRALEESIEGLDLNDLEIYVGVSAGSFIGASLANQITSKQMCRAIVSHDPGMHPFTPRTLFSPALGEWARSALGAPRQALRAVSRLLERPGDSTVLGSLATLSRALPVGLFDNEPIRAYLHDSFTRRTRTDDFRSLMRKLIVVAADLDSGEAVRFGSPGQDHVPISLAVQASTALPGVYPPVLIDGRYYVDGVLLKTLHASVALDEGLDLFIGINPIVPVDTVHTVEHGIMRRGKLIDRGLLTVLSQTFRTMIHSRMVGGFATYAARYPDTSILLLEPRRTDYRMFFTNIFSFRSRRDTCEHAYRSTRDYLRQHQEKLGPMLASHGLTLRTDMLKDEHRDLWRGVGLDGPASAAPVTRRLHDLLDRLDDLLDAPEDVRVL
ncbi:MAG: patatin-like phospholipase family protein [Acidobacteriota bacterium]|nr:MAG: patatin-like phospholipase family protein [Acidobacteriota bacterium]